MAAQDYAAAIDPREGLFSFDTFRGLRNNIGRDAFAPGDLSVALNVDIDDSFGIRRRSGFSVVSAGIDRSVWAEGPVCLGVGSNTLKQIHSDYTVTTLSTGLAPGRPLSYAAVGPRVFWSNGVDTGVVQDSSARSWGLAWPALPAASVTGGSLTPGTYQYAVVFLRDDGQEGGTGRAGTIELAATGGIALSNITVSDDPTVAFKAIYMSVANGETLFAVGLIPNAQPAFTLSDPVKQASPLMTQFLAAAPAGDYIAEFMGHMLVASGRTLYASEPYAPELFDLRKAIPFLDDITMLAPMQDGSGVFIGTRSQVLWLQGAAPAAWAYRECASYGVVPGTLAYADGNSINRDMAKDKIAFFATQRGLCVGTPGGGLTNITEERFAYPIQPIGAGVVRRHRGQVQYLCAMRGPETAGSVAA